MEDKRYTTYDVLVGVFNFLPKRDKNYFYDSSDMCDFFGNNGVSYNVLRDIPFDEDRRESREVLDAYSVLRGAWIINISGPFFRVQNIDRGAIKAAFRNWSGERFNKKELRELKKISKDFQKRFGLEKKFN